MPRPRTPSGRFDLLFDAQHPRPPRYRARVKGGGYRRTTVSLPTDLYQRMTARLRTRPGLTVSAFVSEVLQAALDRAAPPEHEG
jgi:hypothetical protein